jgi:hypothetical protein
MAEMGFIIFLFYSNLLMGEFEASRLGQKVGFVAAVKDVFDGNREKRQWCWLV